MRKLHAFLQSRLMIFGAALLLLPIMLWSVQRTDIQLVESRNWLEHSYKVLNHIERLSTHLELVETARRGFTITGQEQYLRVYYSAEQHISEDMFLLTQFTADNPVQQQSLKLIGPVAEQLINLARKDIEPGKVDPKQAMQDMSTAKVLIDKARGLTDDMRAEEEKLLTIRGAANDLKLHDLRLLLLAMLACFVVLLGAGYFSMRREINQRKGVETGLVMSQMLNEITVKNLSLMGEMTGLLQACSDTVESLEVIAQFASRLLKVDSGTLYLLRESRNQVEAKTSWGAPSKSELIFHPDDCWSLRRGKPHILDRAHLSLTCKHLLEHDNLSSLCVPIVAQGNVLGILHLENHSVHDISEVEVSLASNLASQIALALASIKLRDTLRNLSVRDPLTGLFNRRYMEESLQREIANAERKNRPLGLAMIDLDHFKRFNDTFGHDAGDLLMREVSKLLMQNSRGGDIACRFGGEEFVMIYPEANAEIVTHLAEKLRQDIYALQLQHFGHSLGQVTASFGLSFYPEHGDTTESLLRAADMALYVAKAAGRNRIELAQVVELKRPQKSSPAVAES